MFRLFCKTAACASASVAGRPRRGGKRVGFGGGPFPPLEKRRALKKKKKVHFRSTQGTDDPLPCNTEKNIQNSAFQFSFCIYGEK